MKRFRAAVVNSPDLRYLKAEEARSENLRIEKEEEEEKIIEKYVILKAEEEEKEEKEERMREEAERSERVGSTYLAGSSRDT
jgi:hypothetical protein